MVFPDGVSLRLLPQDEFVEMNEDRNASINIPKEVPFTVSHLTINGNVQFNMNYNAAL